MLKTHTLLLAALAMALAAPLLGQDTSAKATVPELIAVLKSNASREAKAGACKQLARVGTKEAVPVLAALLGDEQLADMARYALESLPDPAVDEAFRAGMASLKGRPLVGVICSIGARRDTKASPLLAKRLQDADSDVAQAAARSLGRLGTAEAAKALQGALAGTTGAQQIAICEGLFRSAAALAAQGQPQQAIAIYDRLRALPGPQQVRAGATVAAILTRQKDGVPLLAQQLRNPDYVLFAAAMRAALQLPGTEVTPVLTGALGQLSDDRQIAVILVLGKRGDPAAVAAIAARAKTAAKPVRLAAIRALGELGQAAALPVLRESLADADSELAKAALESMAVLPGREVDAAVMGMLTSGDGKRRLAALELVGRRRMTSAVPALLAAAAETDAQVRSAAMRRLGELGGPAELSTLLGMLARGDKPEDLAATEEAILGVLAHLEDPESQADRLAALLAQSPPAQKESLLRILGAVRGAKALKSVRAAVADSSREVQATALRVLGAWKTPDVVPELLAVAQSVGNPNHRMLALHAYLGWAGRADQPAAQRLAICRQAGQLVQRVEEKRLLLSALGSVDSPEAMALIVPHLSDKAIKAEAAAAAVAVAERVLKRPDAATLAAQLVGPLEKVTQASVPPQLAQRAKAALQQAKGKVRKK